MVPEGMQRLNVQVYRQSLTFDAEESRRHSARVQESSSRIFPIWIRSFAKVFACKSCAISASALQFRCLL
jgi:hypothetical protein